MLARHRWCLLVSLTLQLSAQSELLLLMLFVSAVTLLKVLKVLQGCLGSVYVLLMGQAVRLPQAEAWGGRGIGQGRMQG